MSDRPGLDGPWPPDPQVPSEGSAPVTPSYPVPPHPYGPPQQPQYPAQAPSFMPPGQPYAGPPYQAPYLGPQHPGLQPYDPVPAGAGQDRVPARFGVVAVAAVVLLLAVGVGVAVWSMSTTPQTTAASVWTAQPSTTAVVTPSAPQSPSSAPSKLGNCSGRSAGTPGWRAVIPTGWTCTYQAGNEVTLVNDAQDVIMVRATNASSAVTACSTELAREAKVTALPDGTWGGKASKTSGISYQGYTGQARCVSALGYSYVMIGIVTGGSLEQLVTAETALTQSWVWSS